MLTIPGGENGDLSGSPVEILTNISGTFPNGTSCSLVAVTSSATWVPISYFTPANGGDILIQDVVPNSDTTATRTAVVTAQIGDGTSNDVMVPVIAITEGPMPTVTTTLLPGGTVDVPWVQTLNATGGWPIGFVPPPGVTIILPPSPYAFNWQISSGTLPPGIYIDLNTGEFGGSPTAPGLYTFAVTADPNYSFGVSAPQSLSISIAGLTISSPESGAMFPVGGAGNNFAGPITFDATTSDALPVAWTMNLSYRTTAGKCSSCGSTESLQTASGASGTESYTSMGGQLVATAVDTGNAQYFSNVTVFITGVAIPTATELALLDSIYPGATPNLLSGISKVESSIQQFSQESNMGVTASWPTESKSDGGSHIGLMQMPVAMDVAWDFTINANDAEQLFEKKLASATRIANNATKAYLGLPSLGPRQVENMALVLYGPYPKVGIANQYYAPFCQGGTPSGTTCTGGVWVWVVNTAGNPKGVAYANKCRSSIQ
jgi:hypothetical protein